MTGTCECVSYLGPGLGGGHGWLQGRHGLVSDQFVSMNVVLANGSLITVDEHSELFWAMKGAGHNFGIVTSMTSKIYDIQHPNYAMETLIFSGDQVEAVYQVANEQWLTNGKTNPVDLINWSYWYFDPTTDPDKVSADSMSARVIRHILTVFTARHRNVSHPRRSKSRRRGLHETVPQPWTHHHPKCVGNLSRLGRMDRHLA